MSTTREGRGRVVSDSIRRRVSGSSFLLDPRCMPVSESTGGEVATAKSDLLALEVAAIFTKAHKREDSKNGRCC